MGVLQQLSLLIWKDVKLRIRSPVLTLLSVVWPIVVFTAVAIIRNDFPPEQHPNCYYNAKAMPSSGAVDFMQSYMCDLETACIPGNSSTIESNAVPSYTGASVSQVFDTLDPIISNENITASLNGISGNIDPLMDLANSLEAAINITDVDYRVGELFKNESHVTWFLKNEVELDPDVVDAFLDSYININQLLDLTGYVNFYRITCNETELQKYLSFPYGSDPRRISKELCRINVTTIPAIIEEFQEQLNIEYLILQFARFTSALSGNEWYDWIAAIEDALNVLESLDAFPELQEFIKGAWDSYDLIIAVRDVITVVEEIQSDEFEVDYETMVRSVELLDSLFGNEDWWLDLKASSDPILDFLYERDNERNSTKLENLFREGRLETILEDHFGETYDVIQAFMNASINLDSLPELLEDDGCWLTSQICNGSSSITEFLEFAPKVNISRVQQVLCRDNVTEFWQDLIAGMDAILVAKEIKEYFSNRDDDLDWALLLRTLYNFTERSDLPEFFNIDIESIKLILDDDMTQAFIDIFGFLSNTSVEEWFTEQTLTDVISILDDVFANQTWWAEVKRNLGLLEEYQDGSIDLDTLLNSDSLLKLLELYVDDAPFVIDALRNATLYPQQILELFQNRTTYFDMWQVAEMVCSNDVDITEFITFDPDVDVSRFLMEICSSNLTMLFQGLMVDEDVLMLVEQIISYLSNTSSTDLDLSLIVKEVLDQIEGLPENAYLLVDFVQAYQNGELEMWLSSFSMFMPIDDLLSTTILNGTWTAWLNSSFYQIDPELVYNLNSIIGSLDDMINVLREQLLNVCPEVESGTIGACAIECQSHEECATGRICCGNGCGTTCIDEVSPELRQFIDGVFGLLGELSNLLEDGSVTSNDLAMLIQEIASLELDTFVCNSSAIEAAIGSSAAADLATHLDTICDVNITALLLEAAREFNVEEFTMAIEELFLETSPSYDGERISFEEFVNNFEMLVENLLTTPEIFTEIESRYNLTFNELLNLFSVFMMPEYDPMNLMNMFNIDELLAVFIGSNTTWYYDTLRNIHFNKYMTSLTIEYIPMLYGLEIRIPTLDGILVNATETRKLIEVTLIVPEIADLLLSLTMDPTKMVEFLSTPFPFLNLCETGNFENYFMLSDLSTTDVAAVEQQLCAIDVSLIKTELAEIINLDEIMHEISLLTNTSIVPPPYNWTEAILLQQQSHVVYAELASNPPRITLDEEWLQTTQAKLTTVAENWLEEITTNAFDTEHTLEQLTMLFSNESWYKEFQKQLSIAVHVNSVLNQQLIMLNGTIIDLPKLESLFVDASEIRDILELADILPEIVDIFFSLTITTTDKFIELLMMDEPFTVMCTAGDFGEYFTLLPDSSTDLVEVEEAICSINLTVLQDQLLDVFGIADAINQDEDADLAALFTTALDLSETIQQLIDNPPTVDVDMEWLNKTLTELSNVYEQWITRLTSQEDMRNDLESLQTLLSSLMELDEWESIERIAVITQQIIAYLDGEIQDLPGQNLTFADIFPPATAEYLEIMLDQSSEIIALQLGSEIDVEAFMAFLENDDPFVALCSDVAVLESFVKVAEGVDLTELHTALCSLDLTATEAEWTQLFSTYSELLEAQSAFNLTESIVVISNFVSSITALIENPPNFEMYNEEWFNDQWNATLRLLETLQSQWVGQFEDLSNSTSTLLDALTKLNDQVVDDDVLLILHTTNAYLEFLNGKLQPLPGANISFVELLVSGLIDKLESAGVEEDIIQAIQNADFDQEKIIEAYIEGDLVSSLCGDSETLLALIQFEESVNVSKVQEVLCGIDLESWINSTSIESLLEKWTTEFIPTVDKSVPFDWLEFHANIENLLLNIEAISADPPMFTLGVDTTELNVDTILEILANYSEDMTNFNFTDVLWSLGGVLPNDNKLEEFIPVIEFAAEIVLLVIENPDDLLNQTALVIQESLLDNLDWTENNVTSVIINSVLLTYKFAQIENSDEWESLVCNESTFKEMLGLTDSVDVSVIQMLLCSLNRSLLFEDASDLYGFDVLEVVQQIDSVLSLIEDLPIDDINLDALEDLLALIELLTPIILDDNLYDVESTLSELLLLLNTPVNEVNETRLEILLSYLLEDDVSAVIYESLQTALRIQEMYSSGDIGLTDIAKDIEEYFEDAGLREQVQPYIEIYNLILESLIQEIHEGGDFLIGLFNTSVPLETLYELMDVPVEELEASLLSSFFSTYELASIYNHGNWNIVFCNSTNFREKFNVIGPFNVTAVQQAMCSMNTTAFFIHASNAHYIDVLEVVAQIDRIVYPSSEMTPLEDSEWEDVVARTIEVVDLLSWLSTLYDMPGTDDYSDILARLTALQDEQNSQNMEDLLQIIEDVLPYINDYSWISESLSSDMHIMDLITNYQNISSSTVCELFEMLTSNTSLWNDVLHPIIVQVDVAMVIARHSILQLPEKVERFVALLTNTAITADFTTVLIETWPGLMESVPVVLSDPWQLDALMYVYNDYSSFEAILCNEEALKTAFGVDQSVNMEHFVVTTCNMHMIRETEFVQEMYRIIDATSLVTDIEKVSQRTFDCFIFYADVERFVNDVISVSGNLSRLLDDGLLLDQYIDNVFELLAYLSELGSDEIDGLTSIISIIEQLTSDDINTDLLRLIIEILEYEIPGQFNSTEVPVLVRLADILSNSTEVSEWLSEATGLSTETIEQVMNLFINTDVLTYLEEFSGADIYSLLCNETTFGDLFTSLNTSVEVDYAEICSPTNSEIIQYIYEAIDILKLIQHMKNQTEQSDDLSIKENLMELYELFMDVSDESLGDLLGISHDVQYGIGSVYDLVAILSSGSEFSDIFRSTGKVLDDIEPLFGESDIYQQIAMLMDALENLGYIRNLLGELPTFKLGNMFYDADEVEKFMVTELGLSEESAEDLLESFVILENIIDLERIDSFASFLCDEEQLNKLLTFPPNTSTSDIADGLCDMEPEKLVELGDFLFQQLDVADIVTDIVKFTINDQLENATESVQKVTDLINQLQDALPALTSTMNISSILPEDILEDLTGTVSAQTANEALQVFVCGTTVEDVGDTARRRRRRETTRQRREEVSGTHMEFSGANVKATRETESNGRQKRELTGGTYMSDAKTPFCDDLYRYINNEDDGVIAWTYLKPVLLGKIPYSPNSPAAKKIVKEANYMFDEIKQIRDFCEAWLAGSEELSTLNTDEFDSLVELLDNTFVKDLLTEQVDIDANSLNSILKDGIGITTEEIEEINVLAELILNFTNCIELDRFVPYETEEDMLAAAEELYDDNKLFAAIRFLDIDDATEVPNHVSYQIRVEIDNTPDTTIVTDHLWRPGPNNNFKTDQQYLRVFIIVQDMLDRGIINLHSGRNGVQPTTYIQQIPYPCYQDDVFAYYITYAIPVFLTIAFIVIIAVMSYSQVYEKENGLEETMMIMGLKSRINWISWFFVNLIILTILSITITVIMKYGDILSRSDVFVVFVFIECFVFSIIMMSYMVGSMCQRPNIAALAAALVYSISFIPVFLLYLLESKLDFWVEIVLCLLSPSAFCYGCEMLSRFEEQVVGATWSNFDTNPVDGVQLTFGLVCAIMVADGIIYFILGWYAKNVFPGNYGIGKPWYFPLMPSYWCGCSCEDTSTEKKKKKKYKHRKQPIESESTMENEPTHLPLGVSCVNLTKKYNGKKTPAVDNFSFNFYEGQVSVLLGHNGAGKTTLMSMLTGFYSPTSGQAYIGDYSIKTDAGVIRRDLGFCPQHNALYDNLTVKEHLHVYGTLKGVSESRIQDETKIMLETLEMTDMKDQLAKNLSGGMKRKLSVAIALFAGSKVIILDEPTSGVDPNARRAIWDLIVQYKEGRTIILCTHFMDEADILGDRIAFLDHGRLKCCGSPMFLKHKYGSGYKLTLVKENASHVSTPSTTRASRVVTHTNASGSSQRSDSFTDEQTRQGGADRPENEYVIHPSEDDQQSTSHVSRASSAQPCSRTNVCDTNSVTQFIESYVEGAKLSEDIGSELSYNLPIENGQAQKFETFFNVLDSELENLHVTSYGISNTSLEEVFFKICGTRDDESKSSVKSKKKKASNEPSSDREEDNWALNHEYSDNSDISFRVIHQFQAIMYKRFHSVRRDIRGFFWTIIFPTALIALALLIKEIRPSQSFPSLRLDPAMFESPSYLFFSNGDTDDPFVDQMTQSLVYSPGIGTSCMVDSIDTSEYPCIEGDVPILASEFSYSEKVNIWEEDREAPTCSCGDGYSICPEGAGGATPPAWQTNTTTYLQDLSLKMDINEYLLHTSSDFTEKRYIGVTFDDIRRNSNGTEHVARAWYDNNGLHALPTSLNVLNNIILRSNFPRNTAPTYGITAYNYPLKFAKSYLMVDALLEAGINYGISVLILCAFSMIPASFVMYLVSENLNGTKRLHYVSGMSRILYILSNLIWDLIYLLIPVAITLLIVYLFDAQSFASPDNMPAFVTLLLLYGWAVIPAMYITVRAFKDAGTAFITLFCANIFIAILTNLPLIVKELFPDADHEEIYETINYCCLAFPQYCLAGGLTNLIYNQMEADMYIRFGIDTFVDPFSEEMLQWNYIALAAEGAFFLTVAIFLEYIWTCNCNCGTTCCITNTDLTGEDDDVRQERERVVKGGAKDAMVTVKNLKKIYRAGGNKIVAVDSLCVGIQKGECFGLLGVNGAGKTTTFKILTGDAEPSTGSVSIDSNSRIGYCPQKDAVCDLTTGHELLVCYGLIKGLSIKQIKKIIPLIAGKLGMDRYINKRISTYSGGMKRSLSTAISLIGDPNILFLDEPTTGMDPISRRKVWQMIISVLKAGKSVVLTSHSMEECEALCTRLAIMVNGRFKCIGSPQHVKSRFGDNFTIILRGADEQAVRQITTFFVQHYPTAILKECHLNLVQYELPMKSTSLADIFGNIERHKAALMVEDYSVTQTSLEQVFLNFVRRQTDGIEEPGNNVYDNFGIEPEEV